MKKIFGITLLLAVCMVSFLFSSAFSEAEKEMDLTPRADIEKNSDVWEFLIEPEFDQIPWSYLYQGFISVKKGEYWGIYDLEGNEVIKPDTYKGKISFSKDGLAAVRVKEGGKRVTFFIDKNSKMAFPGKFKFAGAFIDGIAVVGIDGGATFIDTSGKQIAPTFYEADAFFDGLAIVYVAEGKGGYINPSGEFAIEPKFKKCTRFSKEELALVQLDDGKYGYINRKGEFITSPEFTYGAPFSDGYALVSKDPQEKKRTYYFIDAMGKEALGGLKTISKNSFKNGMAVIRQLKDIQIGESTESLGVYGAINTKGEIVVPVKYYGMKDFNEEGVAEAVEPYRFVKKGNKYELANLELGHVDRKGKWYGKGLHAYRVAEAGDPLWKRLDVVAGSAKIDGKGYTRGGYVDVTKMKVLIPVQFHDAWPFNEKGLARVEVGDKYGIIRLKAHKEQLPEKAIAKKGKSPEKKIPDGVHKNYYENGKVKSEATYKNGKQNGPVRWYHENGKLKSEHIYKDGKTVDGVYGY
ncbi:WG repeat-containing protein, partial [Candidatus Omnitrophota bacterium]